MTRSTTSELLKRSMTGSVLPVKRPPQSGIVGGEVVGEETAASIAEWQACVTARTAYAKAKQSLGNGQGQGRGQG